MRPRIYEVSAPLLSDYKYAFDEMKNWKNGEE